jgi:hypothetical protein
VRNLAVLAGHKYVEHALVAGLHLGDAARVVRVVFVYVGIGRTKLRATTHAPQAPGLYRVTVESVVLIVTPSADRKHYDRRVIYTAGHLLITTSNKLVTHRA